MKPIRSKKEWQWLGALFLYLGIIFIFSHLTAAQLRVIPFRYWDKLVHFCEYVPVGFLVAGWLRTRFAQWSFQRVFLSVVLLAATFGGLDEFHQSFVPSRDASLLDLTADILGSTVGAGLAILFLRWSSAKATA